MLGRRLALTLPTLFGVLVVTFLLLNVIPGDPVLEMVGERADSATIARLRAELRLADPLPVQFGHYLWGVVRGDLGRSYITRRPIARDLAERFPKTAQLALAAMVFAALSGITLGVLAAARPGGVVDRVAMLLSYLGVSFPVYWVGMLLILLFAVALRWLPASGSGGLAYLILPALTLGMRSVAFLARMTRGAMLDVLSSDFVRTARAKGLSELVAQSRAPAPPRTRPLSGSLAQRLTTLLDQPPFDRASWGLLVQDDGGRILYQRNADRFAVPASNTKLVVTAAAAVLLPADYRARTSVYANGRVQDGVLRGDLVLYGRGDPTWSQRCFGIDTLAAGACDSTFTRVDRLADSIAARGIRRLHGEVVGDGSCF